MALAHFRTECCACADSRPTRNQMLPENIQIIHNAFRPLCHSTAGPSAQCSTLRRSIWCKIA
eukprot:10546958-Alexandrium_andersonii.AAC.1